MQAFEVVQEFARREMGMKEEAGRLKEELLGEPAFYLFVTMFLVAIIGHLYL